MPEAKRVGSLREVGAALFSCAAVIAGGAAGAGCGAEAPRPTALLSSSFDAEAELRCLMAGCAGDAGAPVAGWARGSRADRRALGPALETFRRSHPGDALSRLAEVLLAWLSLDAACEDEAGRKGCDPARLRAAQELAHRLAAEAGPGTSGDVARTVEGAALRRQGLPVEALALLDPLVDKLIDPWARALHDREVIAAAIDAGRWDHALARMRAWLREEPAETRQAARATVVESLARVPPPALLSLLDAQPKQGEGAEEEDMMKLVAERLVAAAREAKDAKLARLVLGKAGGLLGAQGDEVAQLAAGDRRARVKAQTVGLALSLRDDRARRRGADIAEGVAFGLGLPGSSARLVSRDDHGTLSRFEEALATLSADGASILVAASDPEEAAVAAAFAEVHHIPVLLLAPPPLAARGGRFSFTVGPDTAEVEAALAAGLIGRGASTIAVVTDSPPLPDAPHRPGTVYRPCTDAASPWRGPWGVVLSAPPTCAREALGAPAPQRVRFAAGLDADGLALPPGSLVATAGSFPFADKAEVLQGWLRSHSLPPTWWTALGHDAAVLAWAGVQVLPAQGTEDPAEVEARRTQAAAALAAASAVLWTTEARGFGGARTLPRALGVREVAAPRRP